MKNTDVIITIVLFVLLGLMIATVTYAAEADSDIFVNGTKLTDDTIQALESHYRVRLLRGRFWYDSVSGLYGFEGGPTIGQVLPGMNLGGPLAVDASGRHGTNVFINGREIHPEEYKFLVRMFGYVNPGRYWLNAQGIAGYEGGPPQFNLNPRAMGRSGGQGYINRGPFGTTGGDGDCFYYSHPNGSSVSNCN